MAADIPTTEVLDFTAGSTVKWTKTLADYPAGTWTLTYRLRSTNTSGLNFTVTATASGTDHSVTITAATSATYPPGTYSWFSYVTSGSERWDIDRGELTVRPDPTKREAYDGRTHAKRMLDAIEATLEGVATKEEQSLSFEDGRSIAYCSRDELMRLRIRYMAEYQAEQDAEAVRRGKPTGRTILTKFVSPS